MLVEVVGGDADRGDVRRVELDRQRLPRDEILRFGVAGVGGLDAFRDRRLGHRAAAAGEALINEPELHLEPFGKYRRVAAGDTVEADAELAIIPRVAAVVPLPEEVRVEEPLAVEDLERAAPRVLERIAEFHAPRRRQE